jgi:hypothetical protein
MLEQHAIQSADALDRFALTASQHYNFGNSANWFFSFRGGYYGVMSRIRGLQQHSFSLHQWRRSSSISTHEHDIASMLFCMDSSIECFVFMLNALGQAADKPSFRDVGSDTALRRISPDDILGTPNRIPLPGYSRYFPKIQSHWQSKAGLIRLIFENHDVTKHRQQAGVSGKGRQDPPTGFYEALGLPNDPVARAMHGPMPPMEEVLIPKRPKMPIDQRPPSLAEWTSLEETEKDFYSLIGDSFYFALQDARQTIILNDATLHS